MGSPGAGKTQELRPESWLHPHGPQEKKQEKAYATARGAPDASCRVSEGRQERSRGVGSLLHEASGVGESAEARGRLAAAGARARGRGSSWGG